MIRLAGDTLRRCFAMPMMPSIPLTPGILLMSGILRKPASGRLLEASDVRGVFKVLASVGAVHWNHTDHSGGAQCQKK